MSMRCIRWLAAAALVLLWPAPGHAQQRAGVVSTLEGHVTATRRGLTTVALKFKDDVYLDDKITTGDRSLARLLLGGKAVVTVRERSVLTITEAPGVSTVKLDAGKIGLAVVHERMKPGEVVEIRTPNAIAAVRGTVLVAEVAQATAQSGGPVSSGVTSGIHVLRGSVEVHQLDPRTGSRVGPPTVVNGLQSYTATGGQAGRVAPIPPDQVGHVTSGLTPASGPSAKEPANREQLRAQAVQTATALMTALGGGGDAAPAETQGGRSGSDQGEVSSPTNQPPPPIIPSFERVLLREIRRALAIAEDDLPAIIVKDTTRSMGEHDALAAFAGSFSREKHSPLILIDNSTVRKPGGALVLVEPAGGVSLASGLLAVAGSAIDGTNYNLDTVVASVGVGSGPNFGIGVLPSGSATYVANNTDTTVSVIDNATNTVSATIAVGNNPIGLAISPDGRQAWVSMNAGQVKVIDTATNTVSATIAVGAIPAGIAFAPDGARAYVVNEGANTVSVVDTATRTVLATVGVGSTPFNVALTPDGKYAYVTQLGSNAMAVIDTATNTVVATPNLGAGTQGIAISPDGSRVYVTKPGAFDLKVLETATNTVVGVVNLGNTVRAVGISWDGSRVFVVHPNNNAVSVIDTGTLTVVATLVINSPNGVALSPDGTRLYVPQGGGVNAVTVVDVSPGGALLGVLPGGRLATSSTSPVLGMLNSTFVTDSGVAGLFGRPDQLAAEVDQGNALTLGTDQPVSTGGALFEASGSTISLRGGVLLDSALFLASAPLLSLLGGTTMNVSLDAIRLVKNAKLDSTSAIVNLSASTLSVSSGALASVNGGSLLRTTSDLVRVTNGSTLNLITGPLLAITGNSVVSIGGALIAFGGSAGNVVNVTNSLCASFACGTVSGIKIAFVAGASATQVSITNPIKNAGLGTINMGGNAALVRIEGPAAKLVVSGN
ncbi:MAG: beta-propeller fold lactonase family protein [Candidatus Rokubacteria bacterium]|nr:beta-propeller fold lactonase family protein [Candidatus Rokubacteria bacterium]